MKVKQLIVVTGLVIFSVFTVRFSKIITVSCINQYGECNPNVVELLQRSENKNLLLAFKEINNNLIHNPQVKKFRIQLTIPDRITVGIVEDKPLFALTKDENKYALIGSSGYVTGETDSTNLPVLKVEDDLPAYGQQVDSKVLSGLYLLSDLYYVFEVKEGTIKNNKLLVKLTDNLYGLYPPERDRDVLIGGTILINDKLASSELSDTLKDVTGSVVIDFSYKNPILRQYAI